MAPRRARLMRLADVGGMLRPPAQVCAAMRAMPSRSLLCTARAAARTTTRTAIRTVMRATAMIAPRPAPRL
eukprot:7378692-Prymnesium_polylepis.1